MTTIYGRDCHKLRTNNFWPTDCLIFAFPLALFSALEQPALLSHVTLREWQCSFLQRVLNIHRSGVLTPRFGCYIGGATWNCCCLGARSVYTTQPCIMSRHFKQNHIRGVLACLSVTCHLHVWQNDRDLLPATVIQRWNGYQFLCWWLLQRLLLYIAGVGRNKWT